VVKGATTVRIVCPVRLKSAGVKDFTENSLHYLVGGCTLDDIDDETVQNFYIRTGLQRNRPT